jgi:chromosome segregation ATPase
MTSLSETLPILDEAVPALPAKLEDVAKEADAFRQAAGEAVAELQGRRAEAEALVAQVREALESLQEQAREDEKRVADAARALDDTASEQLRELEQVTGQVTTEGGEARTALGALESQLDSATQRAETAHQEARAALEGLGETARNRQPDLDAAVDAMSQAVKTAQQAVTDGQALVDQGVSSVKDAMARLLSEAQARLARTHQYLDEVRDGQEKAVTHALSQLEGERERIGQEVAEGIRSGVRQALEDDLDAVVSTLADVGQHVVTLEGETQSRREELARQVDEVEERVGPLQQGAQQVRGAAERLGIDWP